MELQPATEEIFDEEPEDKTPEEVETPAEKPDESAPSEEPSVEDTEKKEVKKPKKKDAVQKRIDKLTREKHEKDRRVVELETELRIRNEQKQPEEVGAIEPNEDAFDTYQDYQDAMIEHSVKQKVAEELEKHTMKQTQAQVEQYQEKEDRERQAKFQDTLATGEEKYPDFIDVAIDNNDLPVTQLMMDAALSSKHAADIFYFLGSNPEEAARIAKISSPVEMARETLELESKFKGKKLTAAPDPIKPISGDSVHKKAEDEMSTEEWIEMRNKKELKRNGYG